MQDPRIRRRTVLGMGLAAATVSATACRTSERKARRFFTPEEARTVDAICEQLIPRDQDAGAHDADVLNYIDTQLATRFRRYRKAYREGVAAIDAASRKKFSKPFVEIAAEQQTEVLQEIEESARDFFELILNHTRQGFYGDPRHGGNRNMASRKMVGLPCPPIRGRQQYV